MLHIAALSGVPSGVASPHPGSGRARLSLEERRARWSAWRAKLRCSDLQTRLDRWGQFQHGCGKCEGCSLRKRHRLIREWATRTDYEFETSVLTYWVTITLREGAEFPPNFVHRLIDKLQRGHTRATPYIRNKDGSPKFDKKQKGFMFGDYLEPLVKTPRGVAARKSAGFIKGDRWLKYQWKYDYGDLNGRKHIHMLLHVHSFNAMDDVPPGVFHEACRELGFVKVVPVSRENRGYIRVAKYLSKYLAKPYDKTNEKRSCSQGYGYCNLKKKFR